MMHHIFLLIHKHGILNEKKRPKMIRNAQINLYTRATFVCFPLFVCLVFNISLEMRFFFKIRILFVCVFPRFLSILYPKVRGTPRAQ